MFKDSFGVAATLSKKRTATYTPQTGATTLTPADPITVWGVWAFEPDRPIRLGGELAPTRAKSRIFAVAAKNLSYEPKIGDELTVLSEKFEITEVQRVMAGDTVITYRLALEKA